MKPKQYKDEKISRTEYRNLWAKENGYKDFNKYKNKCFTEERYKKGTSHPMNENKNCALYLGVYIAEKYLAKIFENVTKMPNKNPGYDFICGKGYKIDVKSSCLLKNNAWHFNIKCNKIADYFLMIAFSNREDLEPKYIWLIKGNEIVRGNVVNHCSSFRVVNSDKVIKLLEKYEEKNKLDKMILLCNSIKEKKCVF